MKPKNIVKAVNTTGATITLAGVDFDPAAQVTVYRNPNFYLDPVVFESWMRMFMDENGDYGPLVGFNFDGQPLTPSEAIEHIAHVRGAVKWYYQESYTAGHFWIKIACKEILDGFKDQVNAFNWEGAAMTKLEVYQTLQLVSIATLAANPELAILALQDITVEEVPNNFLTQDRIDSFIELYQSISQAVI